MSADNTAGVTMQTLLDIMARLRDPVAGCPWDREQDFRSITPYTLEEAYEVVDAIERNDRDDLCDELGDLLFQVVYHAQMANEAGWFDFSAVLRRICEKMVRRHPHVFAGETIASAEEQTRAWEAHKRSERGVAAGSVLDDVPVALTALTRACKLQKKASGVGFDWSRIDGVFDKILEELEELRREIRTDGDAGAVFEETGDLLFAVVNLARHAGVDPESALRQANNKFSRRFRGVEARCLESGGNVMDTGLETLDRYWDEVKREE